MNQDRFRKIILFLVAVIVVLTVFRQGVTVGFPPSGKEVLELFRWTFANTPMSAEPEGDVAYVTRADVMLVLTVLVWLIWLIVRRKTARPASVSAVVYALGLWPIVSLVFSRISPGDAPTRLTGVREVIQHFEYFVIAFALFGSVLSTESARKMLFFFLLVGAAATGIGVYLLISSGGGTAAEAGLTAAIGFEGWGSHARLAVLLAPIFFGCAAFDTNLPRRIFWSAATVASLITSMSGPLLVAAIVTILVLSMVKGERLFACIAVLLLFLLPFAWVLPFGPIKAELAKDLWFQPVHEDILLEDQARLKGEASVSAITSIRGNPLSGIGPGVDIVAPSLSRHQESKALTEEERLALAEAATPPPYLLAAAQMGIPMVIFFLWVFVLFLRRSLEMMSKPGEPLQQGLAVGLFGAVLVFAVGSLWTPMVLHETGLIFALILACIWRMSEPETVAIVAPREPGAEEYSDGLRVDLS
jgi:hypothetical protein